MTEAVRIRRRRAFIRFRFFRPTNTPLHARDLAGGNPNLPIARRDVPLFDVGYGAGYPPASFTEDHVLANSLGSNSHPKLRLFVRRANLGAGLKLFVTILPRLTLNVRRLAVSPLTVSINRGLCRLPLSPRTYLIEENLTSGTVGPHRNNRVHREHKIAAPDLETVAFNRIFSPPIPDNQWASNWSSRVSRLLLKLRPDRFHASANIQRRIEITNVS